MATRKKVTTLRRIPTPTIPAATPPNPNTLTGPQSELELGYEPGVPSDAMAEVQRQSLEDQSKQAAASAKIAARLSAARDEYRTALRKKFDAATLDKVRKSIDTNRKKNRSEDLDFDENGIYQPGKIEQLEAAQSQTYSQQLQRKDIDPQDLQAFSAENRAKMVKLIGPAIKSDPSTKMIMRNWTAEVEAPNDPDLRQILRYFTHRRSQASHAGSHDVLQTYLLADKSRGAVGTHHVWENRDVGDKEFFALDMEAQVGHGLWLKEGESMQVVAHLTSIDNMVQIEGHDEFGWSDAYLHSSNYGLMHLAGQRRQTRIWLVNNEIRSAFKRPYMGGQRAILAADFGPIPEDGFYVLWVGTRSYMYAVQNDWSLNVLMRAFWNVDQVLIRQRPDQRR